MKTLARWALALGTTALVAGALAAGAPLPSTPEEVLKLPPEFTGADEDEDGYITPHSDRGSPRPFFKEGTHFRLYDKLMTN